MEKYICIHGHFYQPPRENAWLEAIEVQDSAHPYHDWNERISAECYAPNTASRILDDRGAITHIVNNYSGISFNFGPTLLSWMEQNDPETYAAILEADEESIARFGHGSALAQVYNHMILPLANTRGKETQIIWGIRDFVHRFNRMPEGMWLAETAVDTESLSLMAKHGIKFTILAPRQAKAFRKVGETAWHEQEIDPRRPYRYNLPTGDSIVLFFYDGDISQGVAFNGLLNDGSRLAERLINSFRKGGGEPQLCHIATDGETYGHHHKHGDMALAFCLNYIETQTNIKLTNYGQFLEKFAPTYEVQIHENSSWSCVHGVERWRNDCGCNSGGKPHYHQRWRKPLRESLDWLRDELEREFVTQGEEIFHNPWEARNEYINVILRRNDDTIRKFMRDHCKQDIHVTTVLYLMEAQRNAMLMYTSCGWFFDEVSGIETIQILQYACRAMQLMNSMKPHDLEVEFRKRLESVPSNVPSLMHAGNIYTRSVLPSRIDLQRVGMHYAVASIFEEDVESFPIFNYTTANEIFVRKEAGEQRLVLGVTRVRSNVTRNEQRFAFAVIYMGKHNIIGNISIDMEREQFSDMQERMTSAFEEGRLGDVIGVMQTYFGPEKYTLWHLFQDEKRRVLDLITQQSMAALEEALRRIYNRDYPLVTALANNSIPIPNAYRTTFEYVLNADLVNAFQPGKISVTTVERVINELFKWDLRIEDPGKVERMAGESIFKELRRISSEGENLRRLTKLNRLFPLLKQFNLHPNLHKSQNLYFEISRDLSKEGRTAEWWQAFAELGEHMGVKVSTSRESVEPIEG
jgi:alpha-amylase/alpha-mannosidase (GH57 family)